MSKFMNGKSDTQSTNGLITSSGDYSGTIGDYQDYLRNNGYSDEVVNGVPQGLNG